DAAVDSGQQRRKLGCRRLSRLRLDRADRQIQAFQDCGFDGAIETGARRLRHHAQQAVDRLAGLLRKPRGKGLALEQKEGASQSFLMLGRKRSLGRARHHRYRKIGRSPLSVATIAEPLLINAVTVGVMSPPGRASASANVLRSSAPANR